MWNDISLALFSRPNRNFISAKKIKLKRTEKKNFVIYISIVFVWRVRCSFHRAIFIITLFELRFDLHLIRGAWYGFYFAFFVCCSIYSCRDKRTYSFIRMYRTHINIRKQSTSRVNGYDIQKNEIWIEIRSEKKQQNDNTTSNVTKLKSNYTFDVSEWVSVAHTPEVFDIFLSCLPAYFYLLILRMLFLFLSHLKLCPMGIVHVCLCFTHSLSIDPIQSNPIRSHSIAVWAYLLLSYTLFPSFAQVKIK